REPGMDETDPSSRDAQSLVFDNVTASYAGRRSPVLNKLSLSIAPGELCVLVGRSGSGKTTALRAINRLTEHESGAILIGGRNIRDHNTLELRRSIGYVIQNSGLFPHMTVAQNIAAVPRLLKWSQSRIDARVHELLALIGLDGAYARR